MAIDLKTVDERLAKAKEEADFWEKARAILADPRLAAINGDVPRTLTAVPIPQAMPGAYGEMQSRVYDALPEADANSAARMTTQQLVLRMELAGYVFKAKDPMVAVNAALVGLEGKGLAEWHGKRGLAKLWRKKRQQSQEAPEEAS